MLRGDHERRMFRSALLLMLALAALLFMANFGKVTAMIHRASSSGERP